MEFTVPRGAFNDAVCKLKSVAVARNAHPILNSALIETKDESIRLVADDLRLRMESKIWANVGTPGKAAIPVASLSAILARLPDADVIVRLNGGSVHVECAGIDSELFCLAADEFPDPAQDNAWQNEFSIAADVLKEMLEKTAYCVSADDARAQLRGLFIEVKDGALTFVGTNGKRMSIASHKSADYTGDHSAVVHARAIEELTRSIGKATSATVKIDARRAAITFGDTAITSPLVEGSFPNYRQLTPKKIKTRAAISTQAALASLRRASVFANRDALSSVTIKLTANKLAISTENQKMGRFAESIGASYSGADMEARLNVGYFIDVLSAIRGEQFSLSVASPTHPIVVNPVDEKADTVEHAAIIMPMRNQ